MLYIYSCDLINFNIQIQKKPGQAKKNRIFLDININLSLCLINILIVSFLSDFVEFLDNQTTINDIVNKSNNL